MLPDLGGAWRQEVLWRLEEEQLAAAAARPALPPVSRGRLAVRWRAARERLRGRLRRASRPAAATDTPETRPETADAPVGVWEEAMHSCEEALAARPDLVGLWVGLSLAAGRLGDLEMSEGAYEVARVLSPDEADAWRDALRRDFPEIDLTETVKDEIVKDEIVLSDELTTSGNGR